ncbi:MAG: RNase adapter RapZ [Mariprofundaceae bacterium]
MGLIITGLSGSGKSTALHALEDLGCFCTDNLPLPLLADWAENISQQGRKMAVCVDVRSASPQALNEVLASLRKQMTIWKMLFLEADEDALQRRFSTVRRRHPFAPKDELSQAISTEKASLHALRDSADLVINTSAMNPYELADRVEVFWRQQHQSKGDSPHLTMSLISFSYRYGIPMDADMVVDARFLPNPHYQPGMPTLNGRDAPVIEFLEQYAEVDEAEHRLCDWLTFVWPQMQSERKRYFTLAIGCSGGRHRSVYLTEKIAAFMRQNMAVEPMIRHRELP